MLDSNSQQKNGHNGHVFNLTIEGKEYEWKKQFITGTEIKQLAGLPPTAELYLTVADPWDDESVTNESRVDLARPEIENFLIKKKLQLTINRKPYEWDKQFITGKQIRELGGIDEDDAIYLQATGQGEEQLIEDITKVDLARPGTEHFVSKETQVEVVIIVNMVPKPWNKKKISFAEVIVLAFAQYIDKPTMVYTVGYEDGPKQNPEGSMTKGKEVFVKNKMIFHATATDKS